MTQSGAAMATAWQHALHWAIASPPMLAANQLPASLSFTAADFRQLWQRWPISESLVPEAARHGRIGRQFEALWQVWLQGNPDWRSRAANLPVRSWVHDALSDRFTADGPVRGELDLLVQASASDAIEHWELAVKFYLGVGDINQPQHWLGPNLLDTLATKLQRLQQQLLITETPAGLATLAAAGLSLPVATRRAIVKGRLYYPLQACDQQAAFADPAHLRGVWASEVEWQQWLRQQSAMTARLHARPFPRSDWLCGQSRASDWQLFTPEPVSELLSLQLDNGWPILVMPNDWSERAEAAIRAGQER